MFDFEKIPAELFAGTDHLKAPLFSLKGNREGPRLVVTGHGDTMRDLADAFWDRTDMVHMRGSLVLREDDQDPSYDAPDMVLAIETVNATAAYYQTLGRMTALGMITGRGVPRRWVA